MTRTVWCASYPKSGNTWLRAMLTALQHGGQPDINALVGGGVQNLVPLRALGLSLADLTDEERTCARRLAWARQEEPDGRAIPRKTHHAYLPGPDGYPPDWQPTGARVIHIVRDPRDVAISWAHHAGITLTDAAAFLADESAHLGDDLSEGVSRLASWSTHALSWAEQCDMPVLTIRYEDMAADPSHAVSLLADFVDLQVTAQRVAEVVEACRFERLAAAEIVCGFREQSAVGRAFFRQGRSGAWREVLDDETAAGIAARHSSTMERFGYQP
jgi:aryl sulfotransferase